MALTPNAWNCPKVSIPGQGDLHAPLCDISRDNWELWKLRPANLSFAVYHVHFCAVLYYLVFWGICMKSVSTDRDFGNFFHQCHRPPQSPCRRRSTDHTDGPEISQTDHFQHPAAVCPPWPCCWSVSCPVAPCPRFWSFCSSGEMLENDPMWAEGRVSLITICN